MSYGSVKRSLDVVAALLLLTLALPLILAVWLAVLVSLGRPVLFRQVRPGRGHRPFELIKFRTMRPADPALSDAAAVASDVERLTRLGRWLRSTSLDELPTLWNVVRGEMSLVGPRPLMMEYLERYTPTQARRHEVRPGITGLAQVRGRNALTWEQRFEYDVWYVDHLGPLLDLRILAATAGAVLRRHGITADGSTTPVFAPPSPRGASTVLSGPPLTPTPSEEPAS